MQQWLTDAYYVDGLYETVVIRPLRRTAGFAARVVDPGIIDGLVNVLKDPHAGGRITRRASSILSKLDVDLSKRIAELDGFVPDGYSLGTNGRLRAT